MFATAATLAAAASLLATVPVKVTVSGPGHTPKVNTRWNYVVRVTRGGRPVAGRLTEQIVDPIGGKHPVEFGKSTKKIVDWPIKGVFRDFLLFPPESRGIPLTFRVTVVVRGSRHVVNYRITPRG